MDKSATTPDPVTVMDPFPRGEHDPAYRWAFVAWMVLFLTVVSLGLVNFLAGFVRHSL
jgi:hypothetical protein